MIKNLPSGFGVFIQSTVSTIKGQMNQKIEIFSFAALPSPNTKKNHPKWVLGKDFSSQAFKGRQKHFEHFRKLHENVSEMAAW